jgi:putative hemolysin
MELLILLGLILLNGVFAASEMALVSSRPARLEGRARSGSRGAAIALTLSREPAVFLSTVQVGITTIGILSGAFGENAIARRLVEVFQHYPLLAPHADGLATVCMVVVVTYCSVVLGEIVPKRLALLAPERFAALVAPPMQMLARIAHPLVSLFSLSSNLLLRLLGAGRDREPEVSEEEVRAMIAHGTATGVFKPVEQTLVGNVLRLDDIEVPAIMTPRVDICWLDVEDPQQTSLDVLRQGRFQTLPVARGSLDHVLGLLDAKDYLARCLGGQTPRLEDALHPAVYVPESMGPHKLLETLRNKRSHVALVVDEYGSIEGLVSLTDLLEAIVGDLPGRHDDSDDWAVQRADGSWLLDGRLAADRVEELLAERLAQPEAGRDFHTLGGLVMHALRRVPEVGAVFEHAQHRFEVVDMDGSRVDRVLVSKIAPPAVAADFEH